jgi:hypothetical protein
MRRTAILVSVAAAGLALLWIGSMVSDHRGDSGTAEEVAEMTGAAAQAFHRPVHLSSIRFASSRGHFWASAVSPTPAARETVFFKRERGNWIEIGESSGCLRATDLGMPEGVGRELGTCPS